MLIVLPQMCVCQGKGEVKSIVTAQLQHKWSLGNHIIE